LAAYIPRVAIFTFSLAMITVMSTAYQVVLLKRDQQLLNLKSWLKFAQHGREKYKVFIPKFLDYYRFNFHPNDSDESEIVAKTKVKIGLSQVENHLPA
jgi:predicted metal-dependent hydrolase